MLFFENIQWNFKISFLRTKFRQPAWLEVDRRKLGPKVPSQKPRQKRFRKCDGRGKEGKSEYDKSEYDKPTYDI